MYRIYLNRYTKAVDYPTLHDSPQEIWRHFAFDCICSSVKTRDFPIVYQILHDDVTDNLIIVPVSVMQPEKYSKINTAIHKSWLCNINKTKRNKIKGIFDYICSYVTTIKENLS